MTRPAVSIGGGVEKDPDIAAALSWLAESHGDRSQVWNWLEDAQHAYRAVVTNVHARGRDPSWADLGPDRVAVYFAQAKSLRDDRASYDFALVSHVAPWLKQLGANIEALRSAGSSPAHASERESASGHRSVRARHGEQLRCGGLRHRFHRRGSDKDARPSVVAPRIGGRARRRTETPPAGAIRDRHLRIPFGGYSEPGLFSTAPTNGMDARDDLPA